MSSADTAPHDVGLTPNKPFEDALQAWTEIDLPGLQNRLDKQGIELRTEQKQSLSNRKELAKQTKDFKKLDDATKLTELKPLLKLYQNEIDALANKQKRAENFFFGFYRIIAEAPDPKPLLQLSIDSVAKQQENAKLRDEIVRLKEDLAKKADYDMLKQRLLRNEQNTTELIASKVKAREQELKAIYEEKETNWANAEKQHQSQVAAYKASIEELKTSKEITELQLSNTHNTQLNDGQSSSATIVVELNLLTREVENWKKRVFDLEKRNETLRQELSASQSESSRVALEDEYSQKLASLESENVLLLADLKQRKEKLTALQAEHEAEALAASRELQRTLQELKNLKERLDETSDYDEIKRELALMRQIEFGDQVEQSDDSQLDSLLVTRNKALTKELAEYRSVHESMTSQIADLEAKMNETNQKLENANGLITKLEADLSSVRDNGMMFADNASLISGMTRGTRGRSGLISGIQNFDDSSILPIITQQRDRFREKNKALEEDAKRLVQTISELKRKNKQLQKDNEDLYERTRYMAALKTNQFAESAAQSQSRRAFTPRSNARDLENPYHAKYESKLHPIEQFRQREQERVNSRLSPLERLFIFVTRSILATRATRMLFLTYCVFLHCVVMFTTVYSVNMSTRMIPEVGLNHSTGGIADASGGRLVENAVI